MSLSPDLPSRTGKRGTTTTRSRAVDVGALAGIRLVAVALNALLYLQAARSLGVANFGIASGGAGLVILLATFADLGSANAAMRDRLTSEPTGLAASAVKWRAALAVILPSIALVLTHAVSAAVAFTMAVWLWCVVSQMLLISLLSSTNRVRLGALITVVERVGAISAFSVLGSRLGGPLSLWISMAAGVLLSILIGTPLVWRELAAELRQQVPILRGHVTESVKFLSASIGSTLQSLDVVLIGALAGAVQAGVMAAPSRLTTPIATFAGAAATVILLESSRASSRLTHRQHRRDYLRQTTKSSLAIVGLTVVMVSPLLLFPDWTATTLFGAQYAGHALVYRLIALAIVFATASMQLGSLLQGLGLAGFAGLTVLVATSCGLVVTAILARELGAVAGGVGLALAQALIFVLYLLRLWSYARSGADD